MTAALLTSEIPSDVAGWWVSEKYDGVRAIWTGSKLLSRHGKDLKAPKWFTAGLPKNHRLDGELWMGRGTFDKLQTTLQTNGSDWAGVQFMVFDLAEPGSFEDRMKKLNWFSFAFAGDRSIKVEGCKKCNHVKIVEHTKLHGNDHLSAYEQAIVREGGEGCVIRRPGSKYRPGRMGDAIKVKRLVKDCDRWQG